MDQIKIQLTLLTSRQHTKLMDESRLPPHAELKTIAQGVRRRRRRAARGGGQLRMRTSASSIQKFQNRNWMKRLEYSRKNFEGKNRCGGGVAATSPGPPSGPCVTMTAQ